MDPPPIPTVRTSREFKYVLCPPTSAYLIITLPSFTHEISVDVPPTSKKIPSVNFSYIKAPATPAAGPDKIVRIGRFLTSSTVITPPSQRITMRGFLMFAFLIDSSVIVAASNILGMILAFTTAVRVLIFKPYNLEISFVAVDGIFCSVQCLITKFSFVGSSTENASAATILLHPFSCRDLIAAIIASSILDESDVSTNSFSE